jgi:acylphosphatase
LPSLIRKHVWIAGRVQNVWFRDACRREAERVGVTGWVQNLADGRVEAVFEGEQSAVESMVAWCHDGPPRARGREGAGRAGMPTGGARVAVK